jgi:hypothetical protein
VTGLAAPPADGKDFVEFGNAVVRSSRIQAMLDVGRQPREEL